MQFFKLYSSSLFVSDSLMFDKVNIFSHVNIFRRPEKSSKGGTQGATRRDSNEGRHVTAGKQSGIENRD